MKNDTLTEIKKKEKDCDEYVRFGEINNDISKSNKRPLIDKVSKRL